MKRPYLCTPTKEGLGKPRLVMAGTPSAARLFVTKDLFKITSANGADVAEFYAGGGKIEKTDSDNEAGGAPGTSET